MTKNRNPGTPGRPACDINDFLYAHVSPKLAMGKPLAEAAREGFTASKQTVSGLKPLRRLKSKHLEKAYRDAERDRVVPWLKMEGGLKHGWPTFMGRPLPMPIGAATPLERKRGRPKKNSNPAK